MGWIVYLFMISFTDRRKLLGVSDFGLPAVIVASSEEFLIKSVSKFFFTPFTFGR